MKIWNKLLYLFIILLLAGYSYFIEPNRIEVNHYIIQDSELSGLKVVFASDFHIKPHQQKRLEKIVSLINNENSDLVLSVGDYVSGHNAEMTMPVKDIVKEMAKVKSKYGFYTTLGNHDGWQEPEYIREVLEENGIKVLANSNALVKINNKTIYIAGVEDLMTGQAHVYEALEGTKTPAILLSHSPDIFPKVPRTVNLTLAGHTHGGQIRLPIVGAIVTASVFGDKYAKGFVEENGKKLFTTKGLGTSILPLRFNCTPEIAVIEFV